MNKQQLINYGIVLLAFMTAYTMIMQTGDTSVCKEKTIQFNDSMDVVFEKVHVRECSIPGENHSTTTMRPVQ